MKAKTISFVGLGIYMLFAASSLSCPPAAVVTFAQIARQAGTVVQVLNWAQALSQRTTSTVNTSYLKLSAQIKDQSVSGSRISEMEANLNSMRYKADSLRISLNQADSEGSKLFELLQTRAEQNKTDELREAMLDDIEKKQEQFDEKIKVAKNVLKEIDKSIQKYDDILGFIQVSTATSDINKYIAQVDNVISQGYVLNSTIQAAINEGLSIAGNIERNAMTQGERTQ